MDLSFPSSPLPRTSHTPNGIWYQIARRAPRQRTRLPTGDLVHVSGTSPFAYVVTHVCAETIFRNVPNVPGQSPSSGEYSTGTPRGVVIYASTWNGDHPDYGDTYPQLPGSSRPQIGYGASVRSPPLPRSPRPTAYQPYPVQPTYAARPPHASNDPHRQNPVTVLATGSQYQGSTFVRDTFGRPYYQQWCSHLPPLVAVSNRRTTGLITTPSSPHLLAQFCVCTLPRLFLCRNLNRLVHPDRVAWTAPTVQLDQRTPLVTADARRTALFWRQRQTKGAHRTWQKNAYHTLILMSI